MTIEVGVLISVFSLVLGVLGYQLNKTNQRLKIQSQRDQEAQDRMHAAKEEVQKNTELSTQLQYITQGVNNIQLDLKDSHRQFSALSERVTRVEESSKQAHKRLDNLAGADSGNN